MEKLLRLMLSALSTWVVLTAVIYSATKLSISSPYINATDLSAWISLSSGIGKFFSPFIKLIILLYILIEVGKHFGFTRDYFESNQSEVSEISWKNSLYKEYLSSDRVQSILALLIVGSLCLSSLVGLPGTSTLKDIALVVVGFYFGTRVRKGEEVAWLTMNDRSNVNDTGTDEDK